MTSQEMSAAANTDNKKIGSNNNFTMIAMILASGSVFLDSTVVNVALSAVDREFHAGLSSLQWLVNGYTLTLAAFLVLGGALGDQLGRRRIMLYGLIGFGLVSIGCGLAPNQGWLTLARLLQGVAGAFLVPGSLSVITAVYANPVERGKAIGTWSAWSGITSLLGPFLGGWLVDNLSWRWVFFINGPIVALTVWLILRYVPETSNPNTNKHLDFAGALLIVLGLGGTTFGLIEGPVSGWGSGLVPVAIIGGLLALVLFLVVERRSPNPMMPLRLFRSRNFSGANLATFGMYFSLYGSSFFITIYIQSIMGYSAILAGLSMLPVSIMMFAFSSYSGRWAGKYGPRLFMTFGPLIYGAGLLLLTLLQPNSNLWLILIPTALVLGAGLVLTVAPLTSAVMTSVSTDNSGTASAVNNVVSRIAALLAIAGLGVVVSAIFNSTLAGNTANLPPAAATAVQQAAFDPTAVRSLKGVSPQVLNIITGSYTVAFHWVMFSCAVLAWLGGLVAFLTIRTPDPSKEVKVEAVVNN